MNKKFAFLLFLLNVDLLAQRVWEARGKVLYEDAAGRQTDLGIGFNPVASRDGRVFYLGGHPFDYGEEFDCSKQETKNWVSVFDPKTMMQRTLFDRELPFETSLGFCIFEQMQISSDGSVLYLVSPVSATSGSMAIIRVRDGAISYVHGVNSVYIIERGPHADELIYQRRVWGRSADDGLEYPHYPFIHARPDGVQIAEISDEYFTVGGNDRVPILRQYLRKIGGTIAVNGQKLP